MKYRVLEQHFGDRQYWAGDEREVKNPDTAAYLIAQGLIAADGQPSAEPEAEVKAQPAPQNKAQSVPQNKSKADK